MENVQCIPENDKNLYKRPELENLLGIYSSLSKQSLKETLNQFNGKNFSTLKEKLSELVVEKISPISKEVHKIQKDETYIDNILKNGAEKAEKMAKKKVNEIKKIVGF